jgi:hypothetical protein
MFRGLGNISGQIPMLVNTDSNIGQLLNESVCVYAITSSADAECAEVLLEQKHVSDKRFRGTRNICIYDISNMIFLCPPIVGGSTVCTWAAKLGFPALARDDPRLENTQASSGALSASHSVRPGDLFLELQIN